MHRIQKFFTLVGLLKYGLALSLILIYLPLTAVFRALPGSNLTANMFVELPSQGVLLATIFLLAVAWSIMFTEGLIVNGHENRFDKSKAAYRSMAVIHAKKHQDKAIPHWADVFFAIPVTGWQFFCFTILLGGPSFAVMIWYADSPLIAAAMIAVGFAIDYLALLIICAPVALIDPVDLPLRGFPLAIKVWSIFGHCPDGRSSDTVILRLTQRLHRWVSFLVRKLGFSYLLPPGSDRIYPIHMLPIVVSIALAFFWAIFDTLAYPGNYDIESAPVVYVYASLLLFVWLFAALNFHLGRLRISSLAAVLLIVVIGYAIFDIDHEYDVTRETASLPPLTPVDTVAGSKAPRNLVIVTSAGGGIWAAGWTALALEKLIGARPQLAHEMRLLSTVSGGSVGAANYVYSVLKNRAHTARTPPSRPSLRDIRVRSTSSSLEAVAYGIAFRDFPRFITGGLYDLSPDRGYLLEHEWARIASGAVKNNGLDKKGTVETGRCWAGQAACGFLDLRQPIREGLIPAVIFNATAMELGRRIMVTPLDFPANGTGARRGQTLSEFLFPDAATGAAEARANVPFWTAARLSATFSFVSPAVRSNVKKPDTSRRQPSLWKHHLVDGGYYDNFGVASALDWLQPVLEARLQGAAGLEFSKVLIVQLRGFADVTANLLEPSAGAKAALIGPLDAIFAIREGVAVSRNEIDVSRFLNHWNRQLAGKVEICTVEFVPDGRQTAGPLSWHLSRADIANLENSWGGDDKPESWNANIKANWDVLSSFLNDGGNESCAPRATASGGA